ncbi:MAG TPA: response regulator [Isosphaeraceae bacterium]|jgi:CheY-like chemotaxis protein|nr:response regulator [Isosphaeraceae bacterium]
MVTPTTPRPLHVLIADDQATIRVALSALIRGQGHAVEAVEDGRAALEAALRHEFDVVLLDIQMPVLDGLEVARRLRWRLPAGPRPWLVAYTADADEEDRAAYLAAGLDEVLVKPAGLASLGRVLARGLVGAGAVVN